MPAAECYQCDVADATIEWPNGTAYRKCPLCGGRTEYLNDADGLTEQEATQLVAYHAAAQAKRKAFEAFYVEHVDRQVLDELGACWPAPTLTSQIRWLGKRDGA